MMDPTINILESSLNCCMKCKGLFKISKEENDKHWTTCSGNPFKSPTSYFACERKIFLQLFQPEDFQLDGSFNLQNISKDDRFLDQYIKIRLPQDNFDPLLLLRNYTTTGPATLPESGLDLLDQNITGLDTEIDKDVPFGSNEKIQYHGAVEEDPIQNIINKNIDYLKHDALTDLQSSDTKGQFPESPSDSGLLSPIEKHLHFLTDGSKSRLESPFDKGESFLPETNDAYQTDSLTFPANQSFPCSLPTDLLVSSTQGVSQSSLGSIDGPCSRLQHIELSKKDPFLGQNPGLAQLNSKDPFLINASVPSDKTSGQGQKYVTSSAQAKSYSDIQSSPTFQLQDGNYFNFPSMLDEPTQLDYLDLAFIDFLTNPNFCYGLKEKNVYEKDETLNYGNPSGPDQNATNLSFDSFERFDKTIPPPTETMDDSAVHRKMKRLRLKKVKSRLPKKTKNCMYVSNMNSKSAEVSPRARRNSAKESEKAILKIRHQFVGQSNEAPETTTERPKSSRKRKLSLPSSFEIEQLEGLAKLKSDRKFVGKSKLCQSGEIFNVKDKLTGFSEEEKESFKAVLGRNTCVLVKKQKFMPYFKPPIIEQVNKMMKPDQDIAETIITNTSCDSGFDLESSETETLLSANTLCERTENLLFRCPNCSFAGLTIQELDGHHCQPFTRSPRKQIMFTCFECEFTCESVTLLADHVKLHTANVRGETGHGLICENHTDKASKETVEIKPNTSTVSVTKQNNLNKTETTCNLTSRESSLKTDNQRNNVSHSKVNINNCLSKACIDGKRLFGNESVNEVAYVTDPVDDVCFRKNILRENYDERLESTNIHVTDSTNENLNLVDKLVSEQNFGHSTNLLTTSTGNINSQTQGKEVDLFETVTFYTITETSNDTDEVQSNQINILCRDMDNSTVECANLDDSVRPTAELNPYVSSVTADDQVIQCNRLDGKKITPEMNEDYFTNQTVESCSEDNTIFPDDNHAKTEIDCKSVSTLRDCYALMENPQMLTNSINDPVILETTPNQNISDECVTFWNIQTDTEECNTEQNIECPFNKTTNHSVANPVDRDSGSPINQMPHNVKVIERKSVCIQDVVSDSRHEIVIGDKGNLTVGTIHNGKDRVSSNIKDVFLDNEECKTLGKASDPDKGEKVTDAKEKEAAVDVSQNEGYIVNKPLTRPHDGGKGEETDYTDNCSVDVDLVDLRMTEHSYCSKLVPTNKEKEHNQDSGSIEKNAILDNGKESQSRSPFRCEHCSFESEKKDVVKRHKEKYHGEYWYCTIPECEFKTVYKRNLPLHMMKHEGVKRFWCDKCTYSTPDATCFTSHQKYNHTHEIRFKCSDCDFTSMLRVEILRHYRNKHLQQKIYACNQCDYRSGYTYRLKFHLMSHAGIKPFKCNLCDYQVCDSAKVLRHIKAVHIGQGDAKCIKLDLTFEIDAKQFKCAEPVSEKDIKVIELTDEEIKVLAEKKKQEALIRKNEKERKEREKLQRWNNKKTMRTKSVRMVSLIGNITTLQKEQNEDVNFTVESIRS